MSGTTAVPPASFGSTGFIAPAESAILAGVQTDLNAAFGGNLDPSLETPQGQLASSLTAIVGDSNDQFVYYCNQVDPAFASGRMQDGIARIYFITRNPALPTVVTALCTGLAGVAIPTGALAKDTAGNLYTCTSGDTIPPSGSISLQFANAANGPIACPAGTLTTIYAAVFGWDLITNPAAGVLGENVETRAAFEARRQQMVTLNSVGMLSSVLAAVLAVPGVLDAYATENDQAGTTTIGGVPIAGNSLYVAVSGGAAQAVAQAIWSKKAPGCGYTGNTTMTVLDSNSGYSLPYPSYAVTFFTAVPATVWFTVTIASSAAVPTNAAALVAAAVIAAFSGADGGLRARIGSTIYASRFYGGVAALGAWAQIVDIQLGASAGAMANALAVTIGQAPATAPSNIALVLA